MGDGQSAPCGKSPCDHHTRGWTGSTAGLDGCRKGKITVLPPGWPYNSDLYPQ